MNIGFKVLENTALPRLEKAPAVIQQEVRKIFADIGGHVVSEAWGIVPVKTGDLRASIAYKVSDVTVTVGAGMFYARYVEFGTSRMSARPYLRPALAKSVIYITGKYHEAVMAALLR